VHQNNSMYIQGVRSHEFDVVDYSYKVVYAYIYSSHRKGYETPSSFLYFGFIFTRHGTRLTRGWRRHRFPEEIVSPGWLSVLAPTRTPKGWQFFDSRTFHIYDLALNELHIYTRMMRILLCVTGKSCSRTTRVRADGHAAKDGWIDAVDVFNGTLLLTLLRCTQSPTTTTNHYHYYYYYYYVLYQIYIYI
jgi:hypothetical protein